MTIQSLTAALESQLNTYLADKDRIMRQEGYTSEFRGKQVAQLLATTIPTWERSVTAIWGAIQQGTWPDGSWRLAGGEAWDTLDRLENRMRAAKEKAEAVDTATIQYAMLRVQSIAANMKRENNPVDKLRAEYDHASEPIRTAMQDLSGILLPHTIEAAAFRGQLERDRQARVNTPEMQAIQREVDAALTALESAYSLTKRVINESGGDFTQAGSKSHYLGRVMQGIDRQERYVVEGAQAGFRLSYGRKAWGVRWTSQTLADAQPLATMD